MSPYAPVQRTAALAIQTTRGILSMGGGPSGVGIESAIPLLRSTPSNDQDVLVGCSEVSTREGSIWPQSGRSPTGEGALDRSVNQPLGCAQMAPHDSFPGTGPI